MQLTFEQRSRSDPRQSTARAPLVLSKPTDDAECEADRRAAQVDPRRTAHEAQVSHSVDAGQGAGELSELVQLGLSSAARRLDDAPRGTMEQHLGRDFGNVRIHTDDRAGASASALDAHAYTVGTDIVFGPGRYRPHTPEGRALLAHELTHVAQSRSGVVQRQVANPPEHVNVQQPLSEYGERIRSGFAMPYPGLRLYWDMSRFFAIAADLELRGVEADAAKAAQIQATINRYWNVRFGDFALMAQVNVTLGGPQPSPGKGVIELFRVPANKKSTIEKFGSGRPQNRKIVLNLSNDWNIDWTPAHEFGHYIGLDDQYTNVEDAAGRTVSVPKPGWAGDIMAETGGIVTAGVVFLLLSWWANWAGKVTWEQG